MKIIPYTYQEEAISAFFHDYEKDPKGSGLLYMATGTGKTVVATEISKRLGKPLVFLVHRDELAQQAISKFLSVWPGVDIGLVKAKHNHLGRHVTVASVQTLARGKRLEEFLAHRNDHSLVFVDECFPAGTLVDGSPIEEISVGDYVMCYNHSTSEAEYRRVVQKTKNKTPDRMIKINAGISSFICTENHPVYVNGNYVIAKNIKQGDMLYAKDYRGGLRKRMRSQRSDQLKAKQRQMGYLQSKWSWILFKSLQKGLSSEGKLRNYAKNKLGSLRNFVGKNEKEKPNAQSRHKKKDVRNPEKNWSQTEVSWWEWNRIYRMAGENLFSFATGVQLGHGACSSNQGRKGKWLSNLLQTGHWMQRIKGWSRDRWRESQVFKKKTEGLEEGQFFRDVRVDSVEILERGSEGRSASGYEGDYVYNLAVEGNNNYFVEGFLVHNCHHSMAKSWKNVIDSFDCYKLGLTATPERSDKVGLDGVFSKILYTYNIVDAIAEDNLADINKKSIDLEIDLDGIKAKSGDFVNSDLSGVMCDHLVVKEVVSQWIEHGSKREKTVFFCVDIEHSELIAQELMRRGFSSSAVHGNLKDDVRKHRLQQFSRGKIKALTSCMILTEGWDEPSVDCIVMARPTQSESLYIQMLGRGLRKFPGKEDCLLLDISCNSDKHRIMQAGDLLGEGNIQMSEEASGIGDAFARDIPSIKAVIATVRNEITDRKAINEKSSYQWLKHNDKLALNLGSEHLGYIVIYPEKEGWMIERHYISGWEDRSDKLIEEPTTIDWCITMAEAEADRIVPKEELGKLKLNKKDAAWRHNPASERQLETLRKFRDYTEPPTMGEASQRIGNIFFSLFEQNRVAARINPRNMYQITHLRKMLYENKIGIDISHTRIDNMSKGEVYRVTKMLQRKGLG